MKFAVRTVDVHLEVPFQISRAVRTEKRVVLVELDEGGRVSRGEASPDPFFNETSESLEADVRRSLDVIPEDPADLATLKRRLDERFPHGGAAACALDILAHDRAAQAAGVPLRTFLGLAPAEAPPTSFTIGIAEPAVMAERAAAAAARGFEVLKVKLGHGDDVEILSRIRERFAGVIRVDPNAAWTPRDTPARIESIARFGIEFVEQPTPVGDIEGLRYVRERSALPIVADEAAVRLPDVDRLAGACDGINVKLQKCGGVAEGRAMIARAHELGMKVMLGCRAAETSVAIAAAAHLAPSVEWADLDGNLLIVDDPFRAVPVVRGRFVFSDRPGLGALPA
ncbi:MAG TPA: dipeptide epimerase [Candidatus Limnocylindria bacterium]|jgi:L-alanine-DL-glutamate epimerase-like enolase superfamily enzyme|nr:dipeptide epimerase [Candidatus Limnocylindria bacterium]